MKAAFVSALALLAGVCSEAALTPYEQYKAVMELNSLIPNGQGTLIVGGTEVTPYKYNYTAGLRYKADAKSFCGGSLIAPKYVLTAAHCVGDINYVALGTHYVKGAAAGDGERIKVVKQIPHPDFDEQTMTYDFAILELETASKYKPVDLAKADNSDNAVGAKAIARGWGTTTEGGAQSNVLQEVTVPIVANDVCDKTVNGIDDTMICAGGLKDQDACQGDSGGPLVVKKAYNREVLVGCTSWGIGCGRLNYPGVYSRVAVAHKFIDANSKGHNWRKL